MLQLSRLSICCYFGSLNTTTPTFRMLRAKLVRALGVTTLALSLFLDASVAQGQNKPCAPSSCGNLSIRYPFRLSSDPIECGYPGYELVCESNRTTFLTQSWEFFVEEISYDRYTLRLVDASLDLHRNACFIPRNSFLVKGDFENR
ncbi:hypothetical protein SLEP1_g3299 [Rubroshorea leprosula]|uniref:Wall-associated receptor kinase galacturonan-binding domain-containing protein n=1 Tax=Rubroshorea leprosula TaxID=152421 RepID=A0AAV5HRE0_9ROSI|nr:hypothetical protein SLEP1_g3299 [Rubroshorea leprosula]